MGLRLVDQLGELVEGRWRAASYDPQRLPEIAAAALEESNLPERLSPDEIVAWALTTPALPAQRDPEGKFGQPPLTLYHGTRFYIEALHWVDGTTTIHQHAFSGAFQVLAGSSIETQFAFDVEQRFDGHFVIGNLRPSSTALRKRGDVTPIRSGMQGLIHGLFHLERPSITIVVRTFHDADAGPQFAYTRNGIGADPFFSENTRERVFQLIGFLRRVEDPRFEQLVGDLLQRADLHTAFRVLERCSTLPDQSLFGRLVDRVEDERAGGRFRAAFQEAQRLTFLQSRRAHVKDPGPRFLLGVLLMARRRQEALDLIQARASAMDPPVQLAAWLRQLSKVNLKLQAAGAAWEPNVLGLPEMTDELEAALVGELRGERAQHSPASGAFLERMRALPSLQCLFAR
jgi:hypothetical protein